MRLFLFFLLMPVWALAQASPGPVADPLGDPLAQFSVVDDLRLEGGGQGAADRAALVDSESYASADLFLFRTDPDTGQAMLAADAPDFAYRSGLHPAQKPSLAQAGNGVLLVTSFEEQGAIRWEQVTAVSYRAPYRIIGYSYMEQTIGEAGPYLECRVNYLTGKGKVSRNGISRRFTVSTAPVAVGQWRSEPPLPPACIDAG
jgi:hypothetical protein